MLDRFMVLQNVQGFSLGFLTLMAIFIILVLGRPYGFGWNSIDML